MPAASCPPQSGSRAPLWSPLPPQVLSSALCPRHKPPGHSPNMPFPCTYIPVTLPVWYSLPGKPFTTPHLEEVSLSCKAQEIVSTFSTFCPLPSHTLFSLCFCSTLYVLLVCTLIHSTDIYWGPTMYQAFCKGPRMQNVNKGLVLDLKELVGKTGLSSGENIGTSR